MTKIIVLGSSAEFPLPRTISNKFKDYLNIQKYQRQFKLHDDKVCNAAKQRGKNLRTRASLALVMPKGTILFDAGPDVLYQLKKIKLKPSVVFISHGHIDASYGIKELKNIKIYSEKMKTIKPGQKIKISDDVVVTSFRVIHSNIAPYLGYKVDIKKLRKKFSFVYISDMAKLTGIKKMVSGADVYFADGSILHRDLGGHMSIVKQLKFYKKWNLKKVFFTHIGHATLPHKELEAFVKGRFKNAAVAFDGMVLKI